MKQISAYITPTLFSVALLLAACGDTQEPTNLPEDGKGASLNLLPTVEGTENQPLTRGVITNKFFGNDDEISVNITTSRMAQGSDPQKYTYAYKDGTFSGKGGNGFIFELDNTSITRLVASWPSEESKAEKGIILDQRKDEDFLQADELEAKVEQCNIMPTAAPLPLIFNHTQSRLSFRLAGQNANGLFIKSLILELKYYDATTNTPNKEGAFWAHCNDSELAELILPAKTTIKSENATSTVNSGERYMIGMVTLGGEKPYTGGIWLKRTTTVELKAGYEYIVTLTPEGYNLVASFEIHGFGQDEGYIGIPVQLPTAKAGGTDTEYLIDNSTQLVTLSRLLAGEVNIETVEAWEGRTYTLKEGLQISGNAKKWYKPIEKEALKDKLFLNNTGGHITTIQDAEGASFSLFK